MRDQGRHHPFRNRLDGILARADGYFGRQKIPARQRHYHRRYRRTSLGAGARRRTQQGRRRRARGIGDAADQAPADADLIMADDKKKQEKKPAKGPDKKGADKKANRRGAARLAAVQALYQMDIAGAGINDIFAEFESHWLGGEVEGDKYLPAEAAFFKDVVAGVVRDQAKLDPLIDDALSKGWPLKRIDAILRAVLRAGSYELEHRKDVPARVVVSEYVDVAHAFVDGDETGMVNAVLDQIARQFRAEEFVRG